MGLLPAVVPCCWLAWPLSSWVKNSRAPSLQTGRSKDTRVSCCSQYMLAAFECCSIVLLTAASSPATSSTFQGAVLWIGEMLTA
jgi:hypothetical protein